MPIPSLRLTPIEGFADDESYTRSISSQAEELATRARQTDDLPTRVDLLLASANLLLGHAVEPACSARLLGMTVQIPPLTDETLKAAFDRVDTVLVEADSALDAAGELPEPPDDWITQASDRLTLLGAFAHALRAYLIGGSEADAADADRRAASRLSPLREDRRPRVSAAATLWQAALRARGPESSRAMSGLNLVLSRPRIDTLPYSFFARLLRCRIIADRGGYAAAAALLTQLEERVASWFVRESERNDALRAISLARFNLYAQWRDTLASPENEKQRNWCTVRMQTIAAERFSVEEDTLFRLAATIPIIAMPDEAGQRAAEPRREGQ
jgi:hypothetical protein